MNQMTRRLTIVISVIVCLFAVVIHRANCGDYWTPTAPPGSDAAKMKTLDQVEPRIMISQLPFVITNAGSYYLSAPLFADTSNGAFGIVIMADDVKLDMNGFALNGGPTSGDGIAVTGQVHHNITIRNGVVRGWAGYGVNGTNAADAIIENVKAYMNGLAGITAGEDSLVEGCISSGNGMRNEPPQGAGVFDDGIRVGSYSTVKDCKSRGNRGAGIYARYGSKVSGCTAAQSVKANGIFADDFCTIVDCTVMENLNGGITCMNKCRVSANTCGNNMNSGILVLGASNRIENNNVAGNPNGIMTQVPGNLIMCNSATGNTNAFPLSSGDNFGAIITPQGGSISNNNPWSNFTF
jgi:hypothetical protein